MSAASIDGPTERSSFPDRTRMLAFVVAATVAAALAAAAGVVGWSPLLHAQSIAVSGVDHLTARRVARLGDIVASSNVVALDTAAVAARIEADPWVASARIRVELPSTVRIDIRERTPVALAESSGSTPRLVASDGTDLGPASHPWRLPTIATTGGLVQQEGSIGWAAGAARAIGALPPSIRERVRSATVDPGGSLGLQMGRGPQVAYGAVDEVQAKGAALAAVLRWAEQERVRIGTVDLTSPGAPTATLASGVQVAPPSS